MEIFSQFLRTEFSEENIEFWLACEEYKSIDSETKRLSKAKHIYAVFIESDAPKEVWHDMFIYHKLHGCNAAVYAIKWGCKASNNPCGLAFSLAYLSLRAVGGLKYLCHCNKNKSGRILKHCIVMSLPQVDLCEQSLGAAAR